jgi:hypothetical protein
MKQSINQQIFNDLNVLSESFKKIRGHFANILYNINDNFIDERIDSSEFNIVNKMNAGVLIPITCGHNGSYNETELQYLKYEFLKANFI